MSPRVSIIKTLMIPRAPRMIRVAIEAIIPSVKEVKAQIDRARVTGYRTFKGLK